MNKISKEYILYNGVITHKEKYENIKSRSLKQIYEVIRIINGKPLFLKEHIERLINSIEIMNLNIIIDKKVIKKEMEELINKNKVIEGNIKIILDKENRYMFFIPHNYPSEDMYNDGVDTILYFGERENPNAKVINNDFRKIVNEKINESNVYEAILVDKNGFITEGSRSNIFLVVDGEVITSPTKSVLPGITRMKIIECCEKIGLKIREENFNYQNISTIEGAFISGTSPKVLPIRKIDNLKIDSKTNENISKIMKNFNELIKNDINF
ncbi:MAG: aminotransferase class IV [Clostridium sp.]